MTIQRFPASCAVGLFLAAVFGSHSAAQGDLTPDQERRISGAAPETATVAPKAERRVLIWNTPYMEKSPHKGYTIPQGAFAIRTLGIKTKAFVPTVSDDQTLLLPENLKQFDAIVMNNSCQQWVLPTEDALPRFEALGYGPDPEAIEARLKESFLDWVSSGGGVVAYHYAMGANRTWPEFHELLGAGMAGHPWNEEVGVKNEEPGHPLLRVFEGKGFRIAEEVFQFREPYDRAKVRVLLSLDTAATNMTVQWIDRTDDDFALAWVKSHGEGRVFYSAIGHRTEHWWNPTILEFYLDAVQFACGDLDAPTEPRPME